LTPPGSVSFLKDSVKGGAKLKDRQNTFHFTKVGDSNEDF
jgi:hypothetical protein